MKVQLQKPCCQRVGGRARTESHGGKPRCLFTPVCIIVGIFGDRERHAMRSTWVLPAVTNGYSQPYPCHVTTAGRPRAHSQWSKGVLCTLCTTHSWCYIHHIRGAVMPVDGTLYTRSSIYLILYTLYHAGLNLHHVKIFGVPDSTYQYMVYPTPPLKGTQGWCYLHHIHICGVPGTT